MIALVVGGGVLALVSAAWLLSYVRHGDAESATSTVVGAIGSLVVGLVTVVSTAGAEGADALAQIADLVGGPVLSNLFAIGLGYLAIGANAITPKTWILLTGTMLLVLFVIDRGVGG
ncbi:hypothetical protein [Halopiger thermotolerans]